MKSYRPDKVASVVREIVGSMIAEKLHDPRICRFTSVTRVEVTADLQHAKVYISVLGSDADERSTLRGLEHARGRVQRAVAAGVTARVCPQIRFIADGSIKKAREIIRVIDANAEESAGMAVDPDAAETLDASEGEDRNGSEEETEDFSR